MAHPAATIETLRLPELPAHLPFSSAVRAGNVVYVSGQIGHRPGEDRLVEGGFEAETRAALDYMGQALVAAGSSLERVVKCTVFLVDLENFDRFSEIYREYFPRHLPARSGVEVRRLALDAQVEIECIALLSDPV
jgi:2-iminobutanoate/2-iminopropanoate deaminase